MIAASSESAFWRADLSVDLPQNHRELVAAEPPDGIRCAHVARGSAVATWMSARSPASWPMRSLIALKPSRSARSRADRRAVPGPVGDRPGEFPEEAAPVEEAGQRILLREGLEERRLGAHLGQLRREAVHLGAQGG